MKYPSVKQTPWNEDHEMGIPSVSRLINYYQMKLIIPFLLLLSICACDDDTPTQIGLEDVFPAEWIFTVDDLPDNYYFIKTNKATTYRGHVSASYSLADLAEEQDCNFYVSESKTFDGRYSVTIQLEKDRKYWLHVGLSSNKQEKFLYASNRTGIDDDEDEYRWIVHKMPDVNDVRTVTIESASLPGWYISDSPPGPGFAATQVTLQQSSSPEGATHWQCR